MSMSWKLTDVMIAVTRSDNPDIEHIGKHN